jgi:putative inorganic carbon (HCO3(-)) transporter
MTTSKATAAEAPAVPRQRTGHYIDRGAAALIDQAPAALLALLAAGVPLFVWARAQDQVAIPRLFATGLLTGLALIALAVMPAAALRWRALRLPLSLLAAILAVAALTTATGVDTGNSLFGERYRYQGLLPLVMYALLFIAAMLATARARTPLLLVAGIFVGGTLAAGYAVLQKLGLDWVDWTGVPPGRVGGAFGQPNVLGVQLVTAGFASLALWSQARGRQRDVVAAGIGVMFAALLLTLSRGAWAGALTGALVFCSLWLIARGSADSPMRAPPTGGRSVISGAAFVGALALAVAGAAALAPSARHTLARALSLDSRGDASVSAHTGLWHTSLEMVRDRPLLGGGPESFSSLFAAYRTADQPEIGTADVRPESAHNFFLDQAVGLGLPGAALVVVFIGSTLVLAWRLTRGDPARRSYAMPLIAAVCAYYAAVFFSFSEAMTGWLPWLLLGALIGTAESEDQSPDATGDGPGTTLHIALRSAAIALAAALLIGSGAVMLADLEAGQAERDAAAGQTGAAVSHARRATQLNPLDRQYLDDLAAYDEDAAAAGVPGALADALAAYRRVDARFAATTYGVLGEARVMARLWQEDPSAIGIDAINARLEDAARLDLFNAPARRAIAEIYASIGEPGRAAPYLAP